MQNYTQYTALSSILYVISEKLGKGALSAKLHGVFQSNSNDLCYHYWS